MNKQTKQYIIPMRKILFLFMLFCMQNAFAIKITHGPYICDMDSVSVTIMWVTDKPGMSWVEIAEEDGMHFYGKERRKVFDTVRGRKNVSDTLHCVKVMNLRPNTPYRYRIFTKEMRTWTWSDWVTYGETAASIVYKKDPYKFKTYPVERRDVRFLVLNDIHERAAFMKDLCKDVDFSKLDFVLLNGDMSNMVGDPNNVLRAYIDTCVSMFATKIPILFNRGNHETRGSFADHVIDYFPTKTNEYYRLQHIAGIDFLFLDSGEDKPDTDMEYSDIAAFDEYREREALWLKNLAKEERHKKYPLIVFSHIPPAFGSWHGYYHLKETMVPTLNKMQASVMLSGHLHRYEFQEATNDIHFPVLVNSNMSYLLCEVKKDRMEVDYSELNKKNIKHFSFKLK